jgi:hypothetical protein
MHTQATPLGWLLLSGALLLTVAPASRGQSQPAPSSDASFSRQKELILQQQSERRTALDRAQRCVQAATNSSGLRTCLDQEWDRWRWMRQQHRQQMGPGMGMGCPMAPGPW